MSPHLPPALAGDLYPLWSHWNLTQPLQLSWPRLQDLEVAVLEEGHGRQALGAEAGGLWVRHGLTAHSLAPSAQGPCQMPRTHGVCSA